jgi:hypothetical protein
MSLSSSSFVFLMALEKRGILSLWRGADDRGPGAYSCVREESEVGRNEARGQKNRFSSVIPKKETAFPAVFSGKHMGMAARAGR